MIAQDLLETLYYGELLSMQQIAHRLGCSVHKVQYWMGRYNLERRCRSEATYQYRNPEGDPFTVQLPKSVEQRELFALAIGLYMGEGTKQSPHHVALANTNPAILSIFLTFLEQICGLERRKIRAWINIFDDCDVEEVTCWWVNQLGLQREQFYAPSIRKAKEGTYHNKSRYGTLTIIVSNSKLKKIIDDWCLDYYNRFYPTS